MYCFCSTFTGIETAASIDHDLWTLDGVETRATTTDYHFTTQYDTYNSYGSVTTGFRDLGLGKSTFLQRSR